MRPGRRHKKTKDRLHEGPSIADFYMAMLTSSAPPIAVPTYQDYQTWRSQVLQAQEPRSDRLDWKAAF